MPDSVVIPKQHIELNDLKNVTLMEKAADSSYGYGYIRIKRRPNAAICLKGSRRTGQVKCITLDKISETPGVIPFCDNRC